MGSVKSKIELKTQKVPQEAKLISQLFQIKVLIEKHICRLFWDFLGQFGNIQDPKNFI